jgi:2-iminobutanoate/2-iminopropanoate deaminase
VSAPHPPAAYALRFLPHRRACASCRLAALKAVLEKSGSSMDKVLKTTCLLNDIKDYAAFNKIYLEYFPNDATRPARLCYAPGGLPLGGLVEVEAIALA